MKPIAEVKREGFIKKMFPYTMDFSFVTYWVDEDLPLLEQVEQKIEVKNFLTVLFTTREKLIIFKKL